MTVEVEGRELELLDTQHVFALEYLANGFNGTQAYLKAHPTCQGTTARTEASRTLANPNVARFIRSRQDDTWDALAMSGAESLARIARDARADIRTLYGDDGKLLAVNHWPDEIATSVRSVQDGPYGLKVTLVDGLAARRLVLEQTGKLKTTADSIDALAEALKADLRKHDPAALKDHA